VSLPDSFERLTFLFRKLPGVGAKTARRMAFFVLQQPPSFAGELADCLARLKDSITTSCSICKDLLRERKTMCVVETVEDLISIEQAAVFSGVYHVLGGRVSPLDGEDLDDEVFRKLIRHIDEDGTEEVIVATNPRIEGDLTYHTIAEQLEGRNVSISRIAYGLPVGGSIEFADRTTLLASLESRVIMKRKE